MCSDLPHISVVLRTTEQRKETLYHHSGSRFNLDIHTNCEISLPFSIENPNEFTPDYSVPIPYNRLLQAHVHYSGFVLHLYLQELFIYTSK